MPKASNFTSGGVQNHDTKSRRLGTIVTSIQDSKPRKKQISQSFSYCELINLQRNGTIERCWWENKKTSEKSVFREAWSPELTSQSFPVPCFWSQGFVPHRKCNLVLLVHQNTGKENHYGKNFFALLISTLGRFDRANKKSLSYTLKLKSNRKTRISRQRSDRTSACILFKEYARSITTEGISEYATFFEVLCINWLGKNSVSLY